MTNTISNNLSIDIERISTDTIADVVELRLRDYFKKKSFKPGDILPKERDLVEALGVSRNVVREALSRLRMLGMVESRKKRGLVLSSPDILGAFERVLDPAILGSHTLLEIFELRLVLEMGLVDLLFVKDISEKDLKELKNIAKTEVSGTKPMFRIKNEIAFHGKLYEIAGNKTLTRFQSMLLPIFDFVITLEKEFISGKVTHSDLVDLLQASNKENFRQGMHEHLLPHFERVKNIRVE